MEGEHVCGLPSFIDVIWRQQAKYISILSSYNVKVTLEVQLLVLAFAWCPILFAMINVMAGGGYHAIVSWSLSFCNFDWFSVFRCNITTLPFPRFASHYTEDQVGIVQSYHGWILCCSVTLNDLCSGSTYTENYRWAIKSIILLWAFILTNGESRLMVNENIKVISTCTMFFETKNMFMMISNKYLLNM